MSVTFNCIRCGQPTTVPDIRKSDGFCDSCDPLADIVPMPNDLQQPQQNDMAAVRARVAAAGVPMLAELNERLGSLGCVEASGKVSTESADPQQPASRATRVEVPDARADGLRDLRKVLLAQLANVDQELAARGAPVPREGAGPVAHIRSSFYLDAEVEWIVKPRELPPGTVLYAHPAPSAQGADAKRNRTD